LARDGIVAYPTDTLYGLAVDPRSDAAVARLYAVKQRDAGVAVPLIAASVDQARQLARFGEAELTLARTFWPGPLTIVLTPTAPLSQSLLAADGTIAIRVPAHPVARALAARFGSCVTATSANRSGARPAATADEADAALAASIDLLLDAGASPGGPPSTIVAVTSDGPRLVRAGAIEWDRVLRSLE
jgi:L-threonylcarbamoyladenylate synthase